MGDMHGTFHTYKEIIIGFGWLTIFAFAFPFGPAITLLTTYVQVRAELDGMTKFNKRNCPSASLDIGIWMDILQGAAYTGVVVNAFTALFTSKQLKKLGDYEWYTIILAVFVVEHILLFFKFFSSVVIPTDPDWVIKHQKKMKYRVKQVEDEIQDKKLLDKLSYP